MKMRGCLMTAMMVGLAALPLPGLAGTISDGLDCSSLSFSTGGDASWFCQTGTSYDGVDAAQSGDIFDGGTSWMQTTVVGPATVSFKWRISSEYNYDYLRFYVDGSEQFNNRGEDNVWTTETVEIGPGSHTLKWAYTKDGSVSNGSDCGWVDAVSVTYDLRVAVTAMTARQRYPWNGKVDIVVTLAGASNDVANAECRFVATNSATRAALNVASVTRAGGDTGSGGTWTRRYVWDTNADLGEVKIADVALTVEVEDFSQGVQLWENGPYWAQCNVGATKPEEYGYYFWWGDTVGYERNANNDGWISTADGTSFSFSTGNCPTYNKTTSELQSAGYIDSTGNLVSAHDAATAHLGAPWRMPTSAEIDALISNCDTTWTMRNGVYGWLVTGRGAYSSRSIFLPAAGRGYDSRLFNPGSYGRYWSSTPVNDCNAWGLDFDSGYFGRDYYGTCYRGQSVRPLRGFAY